MSVSILRAFVLAALLGLLAAFAAACGEEERTGLLAQSRAVDLKDGLADVEEAVAEGSCTRVGEELAGLRTQVAELPQRTDSALRERLEEGIAHLEQTAPAECREQQPQTTPQTTPQTLPETAPETAPTEPEPTETLPPETTPPPPPEQPDTGEGDDGGGGGDGVPGNGNGNGNGPPGGVPPGQQDDSGGEAFEDGG